MTSLQPPGAGDLPPVRHVPDAAAHIRGYLRRTGRRLAVLDDDPTGSQAVHGVSVLMAPHPSGYANGLASPGDTCFVLTNSRSLDRAGAVAAHQAAARDLYTWEVGSGGTVEIVSRGDSTLRGHVTAEVDAVAAQRLASTGVATDGVLFCPAMLEAGRFTVGDTHFAVVDGAPTPVADTEFARDRTFGYTRSNLREFLAEQSGGAITAAEVASLSRDDIRTGGPQRVAEVLASLTHRRWVVVNATDHADLTVVALGLQLAQEAGRRFLVRSGPSLVRALAGLEARQPLTSADIPIDPARSGNGLIVVGSHVQLTTRQLRVLRQRGDLTSIELRVPTLLDPVAAPAHLAAAAEQATAALAHTDVVVSTSRTLVPAGQGLAELSVARRVSAALVTLVRQLRPARPAWIIAKGGITGHDLAARALEIQRAVVVGQLLPGQISLLSPVDAPADVRGCPLVIFPGNVGTDDTLAMVRDRLATAVAAAVAVAG